MRNRRIYWAEKDVIPVLTGGLQKLEYRGYDSCRRRLCSRMARCEVVKNKGQAEKPDGICWGR